MINIYQLRYIGSLLLSPVRLRPRRQISVSRIFRNPAHCKSSSHSVRLQDFCSTATCLKLDNIDACEETLVKIFHLATMSEEYAAFSTCCLQSHTYARFFLFLLSGFDLGLSTDETQRIEHSTLDFETVE